MKYFLAIVVLSVIIVIHELGHFIIAKASGVKVVEFSLGMGPRLLKFTKGGTMYSIKLFLLGGSCQMLGEDEENSEEGSFNSKSVWKRIAIIAAGPIANFVLAFVGAVLLIGIAGYDPAIVHSVEKDSAAYEAGLLPGDKIVDVNGTNITFYGDYSIYLLFNEGKDMEMTVLRDGKKELITFTPDYIEDDVYQIGISMDPEIPLIMSVVDGYPAYEAGLISDDLILSIDGVPCTNSDEVSELIQKAEGKEVTLVVERGGEEVTIKLSPKIVHRQYYDYGFYLSGERVKCNPIETIKYSFHQVGYWIKTVFYSFKMLFSGQAGFNDLSGPVGIVTAIGDVVEESKSDGALYVFLNITNWTIMISANLGMMNLLPIPALDGGRLIFLFIEAVRKKPIPKEKEGLVHFVGIVLLLLLSAAVLVNDIRKLF